MGTAWIHEDRFNSSHEIDEKIDMVEADLLVANCLAAAATGDNEACFDLGVIFSTGSHGMACDLVEAHKWFNLAAVAGHEDAPHCRSEVAEDMTAREIAEAQRRARQWLRATPHAGLRQAA